MHFAARLKVKARLRKVYGPLYNTNANRRSPVAHGRADAHDILRSD